MAYNVTKRFREIVYSGGAVYKCSLKINNKLVPNRQIAKITISNPIIDTTSDYFYVGSYIAQKLTIQFKNLENLDIKSNNDVSLDISLNVDGTEVNVPIGKFLIDDLSENYYETCEITCLDYSVKAKNNIDYSPCFVNGKATIDTIFEYICNHFGITFDTNYPKTNGDIEVGVYDSTVSGKRYISYIAELKGCNAKHGRDGILYLVPLKQTSSVSINALKSESWKLGEKFQISGVSYDDGARLFKVGNTTNNTLFIRNDNPFIQNQTTIDNIYNVVKDTVIWNLKTENYGDISLDPWDNISYQLGEETYNTLMNVNLTYEMNISSTNEVKLPTKQQEQTTNVVGGNIQSKLLRVGRTIDLINGTIQDLSEKIVDISAQASGQKEVELENCSATPLYKLKITGDDSLLFPGDKKKYFTYETYEGSSIDVDIKGSSYDINNLEVKGRSTQEVRSGYNVYKATKPSYNEAGLTITNNGDGTYTVNGTATSDLSTALNDDFMPVSGTFRIVGCPSGGSSSTYMLSAYVGYWGGASPNIDIGNGTNITYTGNFKLRLYIKKGTVCNNLLFKPMVTYDLTKNYNDFEQYGLSPSPDFPSEIENVKGRNICDVSTSQIGVAWNLSTNSARAICNVRVMPNTTYSLSFENINGIEAMFFGEKVKNTDTGTIGGMTQITANRQITTTSTTNWLCIQFNKANISLNDIKAIKLQIEKGSAITNYVPYDTIQIMNTGKNLFDKDSEDVGHVYSSTGSYSASVLWNTSDWINVESNAQYTLSFKTTGTSNLFFSEFDKNKTFIQRTTTSILTPTNNTKYVRLSYKNDLGTYDIQIEKGSVVTPFEEYKAQTINIDLQGNELCSIGDTKDVLSISVTGDTEINKKIGKVVLDGSENWLAIRMTNVYGYYVDKGIKPNASATTLTNSLSNYFIEVTPSQNWASAVGNTNFAILNSNGYIRISLGDSTNKIDEFKTWLQEQYNNGTPVTVQYELATPETINLSPTKPLYLYDGINHLTNDNNADMVAKMVKSTMFLKTSELYVNQGQTNEKKYDLKIPALRELNGVKDEYNLENTKATLTKRIGLNANLEEYILTEPQIIDLGEMTIELNEGTNILTMPSFPNNYYEVTYLLKNEYTDVFASQAELHSEINVTSDKIELLSKKKVNNDEIIASINLTPEKAQIEANKISLKGKEINLTSDEIDITSNNFKVDKQGNLECTNAKVQGKIESNEGSVGGWIISNGSLNNGKNFVRANGFSNIYTMSDIFILQAYISEQSWAKQTIDSDQDLFNFYDVNHDGVIDIIDLLTMKKMIMGVES